jgi:hypothetical protein
VIWMGVAESIGGSAQIPHQPFVLLTPFWIYRALEHQPMRRHPLVEPRGPAAGASVRTVSGEPEPEVTLHTHLPSTSIRYICSR